MEKSFLPLGDSVVTSVTDQQMLRRCWCLSAGRRRSFHWLWDTLQLEYLQRSKSSGLIFKKFNFVNNTLRKMVWPTGHILLRICMHKAQNVYLLCPLKKRGLWEFLKTKTIALFPLCKIYLRSVLRLGSIFYIFSFIFEKQLGYWTSYMEF